MIEKNLFILWIKVKIIIVIITIKEKWYDHCPEGVVKDDDVKLICDKNIQCDSVMEARRPDLIWT